MVMLYLWFNTLSSICPCVTYSQSKHREMEHWTSVLFMTLFLRFVPYKTVIRIDISNIPTFEILKSCNSLIIPITGLKPLQKKLWRHPIIMKVCIHFWKKCKTLNTQMFINLLPIWFFEFMYITFLLLFQQ